MPFSLWMQPTKRSNLPRSLLAYDVSVPGAAELPLSRMKELLQEVFDREVISTFFEGGEPFLREDFLDLVRYSTPNAFTIVRTNGTLVDRDVAKALKDASVGVACVDLEGATASTHEALVRTPGAYDRTINGIRSLVAAGVPTFVTAILNRINAGEMQALLDLTADLGAEKLGILRLYPLGVSRRHWDALSMTLEAQTAVLDALQTPPDVQLMRSWHPSDPNCCWQMAAIDAYGNSIGCPYLRDFANYGSVVDAPFMDTWRNKKYIEVRSASVEGACTDCAATDKNRSGGCRSTAYAFHGRWDAPDPYCSTMNQGVDLTVLPDWLVHHPAGPPSLEDADR